jgi:NAD(P)-dependent dehydrogenase (short-subunit alcohol dehydrogenase family)
MSQRSTFLVLGATGGTGKHFIARALKDGHTVRALVRSPDKLPTAGIDNLQVVKGSITEPVDTDALVKGVDYVISMLGDKALQADTKIVTAFVKKLVPSMREHGVKRFLYQAGGLSRPYGGQLSPILWLLRYTLARGFNGQHEDNEAVMEYLAKEAMDIEWIVHRAGIGSDGPSKGVLQRSNSNFSVATHRDCAEYSYRTIMESAAIHTSDFSYYAKS